MQDYLELVKAKANNHLDGKILVIKMKDLASGTVVMPLTGQAGCEPEDLSEPLLHFRMTSGIEVFIRASQTQPCISLYVSAYCALENPAAWQTQYQALQTQLTQTLETFKALANK